MKKPQFAINLNGSMKLLTAKDYHYNVNRPTKQLGPFKMEEISVSTL